MGESTIDPTNGQSCRKLVTLSSWSLHTSKTPVWLITVTFSSKNLGDFRRCHLLLHVSIIVHYCDGIMGAIASQITSITIVYSTVYSDADQRKHQSSSSLAFVRGNHRGPVNSPHKWPVTRKMFPFDDVIMYVTHHRVLDLWVCYTRHKFFQPTMYSRKLHINFVDVFHI